MILKHESKLRQAISAIQLVMGELQPASLECIACEGAVNNLQYAINLEAIRAGDTLTPEGNKAGDPTIAQAFPGGENIQFPDPIPDAGPA